MNKKIIYLLIAGVLAYSVAREQGISIPGFSPDVAVVQSNDSTLQQAFDQRRSDLQVEGAGVVVKVLADDLKGSRHQKFILRLDNGLSLLVAHNIDLAPRIKTLNAGDRVAFFGEYEWSAQGGVIHWTHRDPDNRHAHGWLRHNGQTYQ